MLDVHMFDLSTQSPTPRSSGADLPPRPCVGPDRRGAANGPLRNFGLRATDVVAFGDDLRVRTDGLFARHRDATGHALGWEHLSAGPGGRVVARYARGVPKGLVHTVVTPGAARIVLTEGAVAAAAACILDTEPGATIYGGLGGHWNEAVAGLVAVFARRVGIAVMDVAFSGHHAAGRGMAERAVEDLGLLGLVPVRSAAPTQGWVSALLARRSGARS